MLNAKEWMKGRSALVTGFAIMAVALAAGCTTDDAAGDHVAEEPIAKVALADGSEVSFSEPSPGVLVVEQDGPRGFAPALESRRSALELYTAIAPGKAPPAALVAAQARIDEARAQRPGRETNSRAAAAPVGPASLVNSTFIIQYCGGSWDSLFCRLDQSAGFFHSYASSDEAIHTVCSDAGTVRFRIVWDGETLVDIDVLPGQCRSRHVTTSIFSAPPSSVRVYDVQSTDRYDVSARVNF